MSQLQELLAQRAEIDRQISEAQREGRASAIAQIRALMTEHSLTLADLSGRASAAPRGASGPKAGTKVPPKYRNDKTGETWSGRGLQPKWLQAELADGRELAEFAITN